MTFLATFSRFARHTPLPRRYLNVVPKFRRILDSGEVIVDMLLLVLEIVVGAAGVLSILGGLCAFWRWLKRPATQAQWGGSSAPFWAAGVLLSVVVTSGAMGVVFSLPQATGKTPPAEPSLVGTWTCGGNDPHQGQFTYVLRLNADGTFALEQKQPQGEVPLNTGRYAYARGVICTSQQNGQPLDASRVDWLSDNQIRTTYLRGPGQAGTQLVWVRKEAW